MRVNGISFKGYDAAPLKNIHVDQLIDDGIGQELRTICSEENIGYKIESKLPWGQDHSFVIEKDGNPYFIGEIAKSSRWEGNSEDFPSGLIGGNTFIGKFSDGQKWMLIGKDNRNQESIDENKKKISQLCNVPEENIFEIPKPDYHLDVAIRPIGFPNVLVNDSDLAEEALEKFNDGSEEYKEFKSKFDESKKQISENYASCDEVCSALEKAGFNPIRIAGVFAEGINFMNAIVNKHPDEKISYITNSSKCKNHIYNKLQDNFEEELKARVPNLNKAYFVRGNDNSFMNQGIIQIYSQGKYKRENSNYMMNSINYLDGGIHCLTLEEPNFEKWV